MRVVFFGTYDAARYARVNVLLEGFRSYPDEVLECNIPLGVDTEARVNLLRKPWRAPLLGLRLTGLWPRLWREARKLPEPDAVVVGYMGHFDVHLARRLWPRTPLALDFLISGADTARDRRITQPMVLSTLDRIDRAAVATADVPFMDTEQHLEVLAPTHRDRAVVVPIGAPTSWFRPLEPRPERARLRVAFFGSFTPLQGTATIARAVAALAQAPIDFELYGRGQDYEEARALAAPNPNVTWGWVPPEELPDRIAECDVCLGIFGESPKALRVVPHKLYEGAAASCALVTSDTAPQRDAFGDVAVFVAPGDPGALVSELSDLARDRGRVERLRRGAAARVREAFTPTAVVAPLRERLQGLSSAPAGGHDPS